MKKSQAPRISSLLSPVFSLLLLLIPLFYFLTVFACTSVKQETLKSPKDTEPALRAKIAQMLMVGFRGTELTRDSHIYADIAEREIGGVLLFDYDVPGRSPVRNILSGEQLKRLCLSLQDISSVPLFIAIDQEGGRVNRLRNIGNFGEAKTARELGRGGIAETARLAEETALFLAETGINLNFAPCVDLDIDPLNPIIGAYGRSFSPDPRIVTEHAAVWISAHSRRGVLSCLKHFPGHGSSSGDTHKGAVDVSATWKEEELFPYRELLRGAPDFTVSMVMTSHVFNANIDPQNPATLSAAALTGLLRGKLGFKGVIVSDDLAMSAITANYSPETALEMAINAGVDILCISNNGAEYDPLLAERTLDAIYKLTAEGKITEARIDESYRRIMAVKASIGTATGY
jgi:beta-N-acetylhexosaminidase